jgi:acetyltransferase-like isoleucine patch superfamily enzyme
MRRLRDRHLSVCGGTAGRNCLRGRRITGLLWRRLRSCGSELDVSQGAIFEFPERIELGDRVFVNRGALITARADIHIGDDVLVGPYCGYQQW